MPRQETNWKSKDILDQRHGSKTDQSQDGFYVFTIVNPRLSATYVHDLIAIASDPQSWVLMGFYTIAVGALHALILASASTDKANYNELVVYIRYLNR